MKDVTIVHRQAHPLSRQLDPAGGAIVRARIEAAGVRFLGSTSLARLVTDPVSGALAGVALADAPSTILKCALVIFAIGITPRDELARGAGLPCAARGGVVVDDGLRVAGARNVYAIGECASWRGRTYGLVGPGIEMADILAFNFTQAQTAVGSFVPRKMVRRPLVPTGACRKLNRVRIEHPRLVDEVEADGRRGTL